jgi:hypothetical protein
MVRQGTISSRHFKSNLKLSDSLPPNHATAKHMQLRHCLHVLSIKCTQHPLMQHIHLGSRQANELHSPHRNIPPPVASNAMSHRPHSHLAASKPTSIHKHCIDPCITERLADRQQGSLLPLPEVLDCVPQLFAISYLHSDAGGQQHPVQAPHAAQQQLPVGAAEPQALQAREVQDLQAGGISQGSRQVPVAPARVQGVCEVLEA